MQKPRKDVGENELTVYSTPLQIGCDTQKKKEVTLFHPGWKLRTGETVGEGETNCYATKDQSKETRLDQVRKRVSQLPYWALTIPWVSQQEVNSSLTLTASLPGEEIVFILQTWQLGLRDTKQLALIFLWYVEEARSKLRPPWHHTTKLLLWKHLDPGKY